jgi:hypothetical protein
MQAIAAGSGPPSDKVERVIAGVADLIREHESLPAIMLREVAEGGVHLDRDTLLALAAIPRTVGGIVQQGVAQGAFREVNPLFAYISMLAPVVFYLAAAPIRKELGALHLPNVQPRASEEFVRHMQDVMRCALARNPHAPARPTS